MRVVVLTSGTAELSLDRAGAVAGAAWAGLGHEVAVVPLVAEVDDLPAALILLGADVRLVRPRRDGREVDWESLRREVGASRGHGGPVWLDLTGEWPSDAAPWLLDVLGAHADRPLREGLSGTAGVSTARPPRFDEALVGLVGPDEAASELLGLRGIAARRGGERAEVLELDALLGRLATAAGVAEPPPGAGAAQGGGLALLAAGGQVQTVSDAVAALAGLEQTLALSDLVVLVTGALDFGGGGLALAGAAAARAEQAGVPCVALAGSVQISSRELRSLGVQSAYAVGEDLAQTADRVARSWTW